jgi:hypothetical protein
MMISPTVLHRSKPAILIRKPKNFCSWKIYEEIFVVPLLLYNVAEIHPDASYSLVAYLPF